jgi:hypothetical protein
MSDNSLLAARFAGARHAQAFGLRCTRRLALPAAALLIAGCGGNDDATVYDLWETETCLRDKGYSPKLVEADDLALLREPGGNGVLRIEAGGTTIDIAFEDDSDRAAARAGRWGAPDARETKGNVAYWAAGDRPDASRARAEAFDHIDACLTA